MPGRRSCERRRIQVYRVIPCSEIEWRTRVIRTLTNGTGSSESIRVGGYIEWSSAKVRSNGVHLPITESILSRLAPLSERRQHVDYVAYECMPAIEIRITFIAGKVEWVAGRIGKRG